MVKTINLFTVKDRGWPFATKLRSIQDVKLLIAYILTTRGYTQEDADLLSQNVSLFFKPNKFDVSIYVIATNEKVEIPPQTNEINLLLSKLKLFNGRGLKYNSAESCKAKYKVGQYAPKEVQFAESVFRGKGQSVIFKQTKKEKSSTISDSESAYKVANLNNQGWFNDNVSLSRIIQKRLQISSPTDIYRDLKGKYNIGSNELNRLIYKLSH